MAIPPMWRPFRQDDASIDESVAAALTNQSQTSSEMSAALTNGLTRAENFASTSREGITFTTPASGASTASVKHGMTSNPGHCVVSRLQRIDGQPLAVWSISWENTANGCVTITFQGLVASTQYRLSCLFE